MTSREIIAMRTKHDRPDSESDTIDGDIAAHLARVKVVSDSEADRLRQPSFADPKSAEANRVYRGSGLPRRHTLQEGLQEAGKWGEALSGIKGRLGTGFLCALVGLRGCGKTQLGVEVAKHVLQRGKSALFASATKFLMDVKSTYQKEAKISERDVLAGYAKPSLLVMDELGKQSDTEWGDRLLFDLLNDRYNDMKDTILLGNFASARELGEAVGPSLVSRINETGGVIVCAWPSFREKGNQ